MKRLTPELRDAVLQHSVSDCHQYPPDFLCANPQLYNRASQSFRRGFMKRLTPELRDALLAAPDAAAVQEVMFPEFARFVLGAFADEITAYRCVLTGDTGGVCAGGFICADVATARLDTSRVLDVKITEYQRGRRCMRTMRLCAGRQCPEGWQIATGVQRLRAMRNQCHCH